MLEAIAAATTATIAQSSAVPAGKGNWVVKTSRIPSASLTTPV